ncbi:MAG: serine/threonine protein kinase [Myxococcota bacterium]|nr:serine/threonine protein kinase [Myxococcota bacterium]
MAQPASSRLVGAVLSGRWRVASKLGEGGMGEVFAAEPLEGGTRVAIKVLRPEFLSHANVLARFLEEGRTCMRLLHPNVVRVIACAAAEDGTPYMVMELLEGVPLGAYTQNGGRVPAGQAVLVLQAILAGLAAAHAQGIVHRDLKPDNVFLARESNGTYAVKILDFGIAKVMDLAGGMGARTSTGMLLGTPAYMSPEQIRSARDVDQRADLWSAGVMFYEMLTGRTAFPAATEYARLAAVLATEPVALERVEPKLSPLGPFVARALQKDRDERFASALEMARALVADAPKLALAEERGRPVGSLPSPALSHLPEVPPAHTSFAEKNASAAGPLEAELRSSPAFFGAGEHSRSAASPAQSVARRTVVALVVLALVTGILLGWALGRMP